MISPIPDQIDRAFHFHVLLTSVILLIICFVRAIGQACFFKSFPGFPAEPEKEGQRGYIFHPPPMEQGIQQQSDQDGSRHITAVMLNFPLQNTLKG